MSEDHLSVSGDKKLAPTVPMAQDASARKIDKAVRFHLKNMGKKRVALYFVSVEMGYADTEEGFTGGAILMNVPGIMPHLQKCAQEWFAANHSEKVEGE